MAKNNIRSIRFSDEMAELIDRQIGDTFTQKFESLVTRCVWELPQKEAELKRLEQRIAEKRQELQIMSRRAEKLASTMWKLQKAIEKAASEWDVL